MNNNRLGIALVILGIAALLYGGLGFDRQKTVLDVGGIKATATEHKTTPIVAIAGLVSLIAGAGLLITSKRGG